MTAEELGNFENNLAEFLKSFGIKEFALQAIKIEDKRKTAVVLDHCSLQIIPFFSECLMNQFRMRVDLKPRTQIPNSYETKNEKQSDS